jgi:hypothetical protein
VEWQISLWMAMGIVMSQQAVEELPDHTGMQRKGWRDGLVNDKDLRDLSIVEERAFVLDGWALAEGFDTDPAWSLPSRSE